MSIDIWMDKDEVVHIYIMEYYTGIKWSNATTQMDLESIILREVSQTKTNIWYHLYVESKKKENDRWTCLQNRNRLIDI